VIVLPKDDDEDVDEKADEEHEGEEEEPQQVADELANLQAQVKLLREDGKSDNEIVRKLFEENYHLDISLVQQVMGMSKYDIGRIKGHVSRLHHREDKERLDKLEEKTKPSAGPIYKTDTDSTSVLKEVLMTHPDISPRHLEEILSWAKMTPGGLHPAHLQALLQSMKGIDSRMASMLAQKYSLALSKYQQESQGSPPQIQPTTGFPFIPGQPSPTWPTWPTWPGQNPASQQHAPPGFVTVEEMDRKIRDLDRDRDIEDLGKTVKSLKEEIPKLIKDNIPSQQEAYETIEMPVDVDGNPCQEAQAVSVKRITRPIKGGGGENAEVRALREQVNKMQQEIQSKKFDDLSNQIVSVSNEIKSLKESGTPKEDPRIADLQKSLEGLKEQLSEADKKRLEDRIAGLHTEVEEAKSIARASGVNSEYGVMATGITALANKDVVGKAGTVLKEILGTPPSGPVPGSKATAEHRAGIIEELEKKGLVTHVLRQPAAK
jgi:hypothetical protein